MAFWKHLIFQSLLMVSVIVLLLVLNMADNNESALLVNLASVFFLFTVTVVAYWISSGAIGKGNGRFVNSILLGTVVHFFLCVGYVFCVFLVARPAPTDIIQFLVVYFLSYFLFTTFEVYSLMNNLRAIEEREKADKLKTK